MKKEIKSYISFTRTERAGLIGISVLLIILIGIRATMYLWIHPTGNSERDKKLVAAWEHFKLNNAANHSDIVISKKDYQDAFDDNTSPLPEVININSADSITLVRLKGIGPVTAGKIIARRKQSYFTDVNQLLEICHMPKSTFEIIKPHLTTKSPDSN